MRAHANPPVCSPWFSLTIGNVADERQRSHWPVHKLSCTEHDSRLNEPCSGPDYNPPPTWAAPARVVEADDFSIVGSAAMSNHQTWEGVHIGDEPTPPPAVDTSGQPGPCAVCHLRPEEAFESISFRRCKGCQSIDYCSDHCQRARWARTHKLECGGGGGKNAKNWMGGRRIHR